MCVCVCVEGVRKKEGLYQNDLLLSFVISEILGSTASWVPEIAMYLTFAGAVFP